MNIPLQSFNMEWYRAFHAAAVHGNLSRAAEELHLTQPAVSHTIKQLETALGGQLFFRIPRGVKLTDEGELLFRHVEQAFGLLFAAERKIADMHELRRGRIAIGAGDTICKHYLLPHLGEFHRRYPDIAIQVANRTSLETINLLKEGAIDLGIVHLPVDDERVAIHERAPVEDIFVAGAGSSYAALADAPIAPAALAAQPLLLLEQGTSSRRWIERYFREAGVAFAPGIELGSFDLLLQFAIAGFGVAAVIRHAAEQGLADGALVALPLAVPLPPRRIGLATLKDVPLSAAAKRLLDMLP